MTDDEVDDALEYYARCIIAVVLALGMVGLSLGWFT